MAEPLRPSIRTGRVARAAPLVALTGRTAGEAVISALRRKDSGQMHARSAGGSAEPLGRPGGVMRRAGQILPFVSRGSLVEGAGGWVYGGALRRLQDAAPPMEPALAASV